MKKFVLNLIPNKTRVSTENKTLNIKSNAWGTTDIKKTNLDAEANGVIDGVEDGISSSENDKKFFGVKSYLNYFYLSPTSDYEANYGIATNDSNSSGGVWYLLPPPPLQRRAHRIAYALCRILSAIGFLLLLCGAISIVIGYCYPSMQSALLHLRGDINKNNENTIEASLLRIAIDQDEEGNFYIPPERLAEFLRDPMHPWKIAGFCAFAIGASIMALSLLINSVFAMIGSRLAAAVFSSDNDANTPTNEPPIRIYPNSMATGTTSPPSKFHIVPTRRAQANRITAANGPVPSVEEITRIQTVGMKKSPSNPTPTAEEMLFENIKADDTRPLIAYK